MSKAQELLSKAEAIDGYRAACAASFFNRRARAADDYRASYLEDQLAADLLREVDRIPLLNEANIIVMHPTADNGYPHTRPLEIVCIPSKLVITSSKDDLSNTLRHEAVHLHQRKEPVAWAAAAQKEGWVIAPEAVIPRDLRERSRINPDTMTPAPFWAWQQYYVPLPLFPGAGAAAPTSLADVTIKWYDLRNRAFFSQPPPSFEARWGPAPSQPEHPFELLAVEAADKGIRTEEALWSNLRMK